MDRKFRMITLALFCVLGLTFPGQELASAQAIAGKEVRIGAAFCISGHGANVGKRESHRGAGRGGCDQCRRRVNGVR